MTDIVSAEKRRQMMQGIRGRDTRPEMTVRHLLHQAGFRFRLHSPDLPGKPDIVLRKHGVCIFVNGCFWHRHQGCRLCASPATKREFWEAKFRANVERDQRKCSELISLGWRVIVIWECGIRTAPQRLSAWLGREISRGKRRLAIWPVVAPYRSPDSPGHETSS